MKQAFDKQGKDTGHRVSRIVPWVLGLVLGLAVMLAGGPLGAAEVYTWTDEEGVLHFSDKPRTDGQSETIEAEEAYRPGTGDVYSQPAEPAEAPEAAAADATAEAPVSAAAARREEQALKREQRREAQAELDRLCAQHRQRLEQMEPSRRVFYTDASGETVRLDDEERVGLVEESKAYLAENCQD